MARARLTINDHDYRGEATFLVKGGKLIFPGGEKWGLVLDAKANPKRIKAVGTAGDLRGVTMEGVYRLEKDGSPSPGGRPVSPGRSLSRGSASRARASGPTR